MRDFLEKKLSRYVPLLLLAGVIVHAEPAHAFEGTLSYRLSTNGRDWEIQHRIKGTSTRTDISLKGLLFQSILDLEGEVYVIDAMSKKIIPPMKGPGNFGSGPPYEEERLEEVPSPPEGDLPSDSDRPMLMPDPAEVVEERIVWDHPGKVFELSDNQKRTATLLGMEGFGTIPLEFFSQFRELQGMSESMVSTFGFYHLIPVDIQVDGKGKNKPLKMMLVSVDPAALDASVFELPSDYSLVTVPGRGGPGGPRGGRQKKGPPPGGGGRMP